MPTYEYRCPNGHEFEHFAKMSEYQQPQPCPVCGLPGERLISGGAGLVFKGSGFYITDYGKDGKKDQRKAANDSAASSDSAPAKADTTSAPAKSDAPAAAPAPKKTGSGTTE
jgi:putative FmdB family regulatory protein